MIRINFLKNPKPDTGNKKRAPRITMGIVFVLATVFFVFLMLAFLFLKSYGEGYA